MEEYELPIEIRAALYRQNAKKDKGYVVLIFFGALLCVVFPVVGIPLILAALGTKAFLWFYDGIFYSEEIKYKE